MLYVYIDMLDSRNGFSGMSVPENGACPKRTWPSPRARLCAYNERLRRCGVFYFFSDPRDP